MTEYIKRKWRRMNLLMRALVSVVTAGCICSVLIVVASPGDTDEDGMSDDYETFFGLNYTNAADASQNNDDDTLLNLAESSLWTDPFEGDTDRDGFKDDSDSNAVSRAYINWGDNFFTTSNDYAYAAPSWWVSAYKMDGEWATNPPAWHVASSESNDIGLLNVDVDRTILTNDVVMELDYYDHSGASLFVDLYDTNDIIVATNLFSNLIVGSNEIKSIALDIPFETYTTAVGIQLRRGTGEITVYESLLYIDKDGDGLDREQEAQLGTSDNDTDSDGDGLSDYAEVFTHSTDPAIYDSDGDGLSDYAEVVTYGTDPNNVDSDNDGMNDGLEVEYGNSPSSSNSYNQLPFSEYFETNTTTVGDINGQNNWTAAPTNTALIQTDSSYEGDQALEIALDEENRSAVQHLFRAIGQNTVWVDMYVQVQPGPQPTGTVNTTGMYFDDDGMLVVYDGSQTAGSEWVTLTSHEPVNTGTWVRLSIRLDYSQQEWQVCINGESVAEGLGFASQRDDFAAVRITATEALIDNVLVSTETPANMFLDQDHDDLPDTWETNYFGNITSQSSTNDYDGDGLLNGEEYAAGTDPTDTDSDDDGVDDFTEDYWGQNPTNADSYTTLPFAADFETNESYTVGNLNGQQAWIVLGGTATVQTATVFTNSQAASLSANSGNEIEIGQLIASVSNNVVWSDYYIKLTSGTLPTTIPERATAVLVVNPSGYWACRSGTSWQIASNATAVGTNWLHVTVKEDFSARTWDFYVGEDSVFTGLSFADTNADHFARFAFLSGSQLNTFIDLVHVATNEPGHIDIDDDGLINSVEITQGTDINDPDTDNDGMGDGMEVERGYDPTVSNFYFRIDSASGTNLWATGFEVSEGYVTNGLNGQNGWAASNGVDVVNTQSYSGAQSVILPSRESSSGPTKNMIADIGAQGRRTAWITLHLSSSDQGMPDDVEAMESAVVVCIDNNKVYAYDGVAANWVISTDTFSFDSNGWVRIDLGIDYSTKTFLVCANKVLAVDDVNFKNADRECLSRLQVNGSASESAASLFVDEISISATEPADLDYDNDGLLNTEEYSLGTDAKDADSDDDGLTDYAEVNTHSTDPLNADSDGDGIPDPDEISMGLDPNDDTDAVLDPDSDGLSNLEEYQNSTDHTDWDSDDDGLSDGAEVNTHGTDPNDSDSDDDGLPDKWEVDNGTDPLVDDADADPDGDGLTNAEEYLLGTDPLDADTDNDGVNDYLEVRQIYSDVLVADFDGSASNSATITDIDLVYGNDTTNWLGTWAKEGTYIYARERSGYVEYIVTAPTSGNYAVKIEATQHNPLTAQDEFDLSLYVDGTYSGRQILWASNGVVGTATYFLPTIDAGDHALRIVWRNLDANTFLQVNSVTLQTYGGTDTNSNGIADWEEHRAAAMSDFVQPPATSLVSPICLEGESYHQNMLLVSASYVPEGQTQQVITVKHGVDVAWYADVLLSPTNDTTVQVLDQNGAVSYSNTVIWTALNVLDNVYTNGLMIRDESSMLFTAYPTNQTNGTVTLQILDGTNVLTNVVTTIDTPFEHLFDTAGDYTVSGTFSNATVVTNGSITVSVIAGAFALDEVACVANVTRIWECPDLPDEAVIEYDEMLDVTATNLVGGGLEFTILNRYDDAYYIVARLGQDGPILDNVKASSVYGDNGSYWYVIQTYNDGSRLSEVRLQMGYVPDDIEVHLNINVGGVMFEDGTTTMILTAEDFDELGIATYRFIAPAYVSTSVCHTTHIYQGGELLTGN